MFSATFRLSLVFLAASIPNILCISEEMKELAQMLHNTCQGETGVAEESIEAARKGDFKDEQPLKCYMKCLMAQMAVMDDDGIIDVEAMLALMPEELKDQKVEDGVRKCGTKIGADACDNAFLTHKCYYTEGPDKYFLV